MKFVVDSGSTKADWLLFNNKQYLGVYNTLGLNPEVLDKNVLVERILNNEELRRTLIAKGLARSKNFSWEKCARETLVEINSL